eukprot:Gb_19655 [translate_table: standard]
MLRTQEIVMLDVQNPLSSPFCADDLKVLAAATTGARGRGRPWRGAWRPVRAMQSTTGPREATKATTGHNGRPRRPLLNNPWLLQEGSKICSSRHQPPPLAASPMH